MSSYKEVLKHAQRRMEEADRGEQAALLYLLELTNMEAHNLYMEFEQEMPEDIEKEYEAGIQRLLAGEPLGHVLGFEWFYGYRFKVNEDVLIPRPETEELVANVLAAYDEYFQGQQVTAADIGTGSGAIAISLKKEEENIHMLASDISEKAVMVANEPHVALFGGEDGLKFYRVIFENAPKILNEKAFMAFEMGYNQKEALSAEARKYFPDAKIEVIKDMSGKNRMLFIYLNLE